MGAKSVHARACPERPRAGARRRDARKRGKRLGHDIPYRNGWKRSRDRPSAAQRGAAQRWRSRQRGGAGGLHLGGRSDGERWRRFGDARVPELAGGTAQDTRPTARDPHVAQQVPLGPGVLAGQLVLLLHHGDAADDGDGVCDDRVLAGADRGVSGAAEQGAGVCDQLGTAGGGAGSRAPPLHHPRLDGAAYRHPGERGEHPGGPRARCGVLSGLAPHRESVAGVVCDRKAGIASGEYVGGLAALSERDDAAQIVRVETERDRPDGG
eukprot:ctg_1831.g620